MKRSGLLAVKSFLNVAHRTGPDSLRCESCRREHLHIPIRGRGQFGAQLGAIDISIHTTRRLECLQPVEHLDRAEIARMPKFVAIGEVGEHGLVQEAMGVGEKADAHPPMLRGAGVRHARPSSSGTIGVQHTFQGSQDLDVLMFQTQKRVLVVDDELNQRTAVAAHD